MITTDPTSLLVAARIRKYRTETLGWSLVETAARLPADSKLSAALLGRIEGGTRAASLPEVTAICHALGCVVDWLFRAGELCPTCGQERTL